LFSELYPPCRCDNGCQFADRCEGFTTEKTHETTKYVEEEYQNGGTAYVDLTDLHPRMDSDGNFNSAGHVRARIRSKLVPFIQYGKKMTDIQSRIHHFISFF